MLTVWGWQDRTVPARPPSYSCAMQDGSALTNGPVIEPVVMRLELPPGVVGPDGVSIDVRCYLVPHSTGVVLVDAGPPNSCDTIAAGLARFHRTWSDVTDIVLTHVRFDHSGGLAEVVDRVQSAQLWAGTADVAGIDAGEGLVVKPLQDGEAGA